MRSINIKAVTDNVPIYLYILLQYIGAYALYHMLYDGQIEKG